MDVRDHLLTDQIWSRFDRRIVALRQMDHGSVAGVTVADIQVDKGDRWVIDGQINFDRSGRTVTKDGTRVDHVCIAARGGFDRVRVSDRVALFINRIDGDILGGLQYIFHHERDTSFCS